MTSYLITTTDRSRWPNSGHLVFIGTFCLPDDSDSLLDKYTYEIAETSVSSDDKLRCFQSSLTAHARLSARLSIALNHAHQLNKSDRHWKILTGIWLRLFIDLLVSRIFTISALRATHPNLQLVSAHESTIRRAPFSTADFHTLTKFTEWNSLIYSDLWDFAGIQLTSATLSHQRIVSVKPELQLSKLSGFVLSVTYLPRIQEVLLQLRLGTKPRRLQVIAPPEATVNGKARQQLALDDFDSSEIEQILIKFLRTYLPTSFLEGFSDLRKSTHLMRFPNNPKAIFTSNRHIYDDVFNVWVADVTENGSRLILGQHGGHYGISRFPSYAERHEILVSDAYLTWGWISSDMAKSGINLTTIGLRRKQNRNRSRLLFVTEQLYTQPRAVFTDVNQSSDYLNHLVSFGSSLPLNIKNNLEIRPHHGQNSTGQNLDNWWHNQLPTVKVSDATIPFIKQVNNAKIVIIAHNGTTLPENLAKAIPTLITWTSNWVEIRDEAKPVFAKLAEVGIFHEDPVSLAKHVSAIWDNVDAWWESKEVVEARELFCSLYARSVPHPRKFLREIIVGKSIIEKQGDL